MYKCLSCGNQDKFYGMVKEQGDALIFQNNAKTSTPVPQKLAVGGRGTVRADLWAIANNGKSDELTWAYLASEGSWRGFHEVKSCAVCNSTDIAFI